MADGPSHMPLHLLESMTDNFSKERVLGSGSYGKVYRGGQKDGRKIAIKILHDKLGLDDVQFEKEFYNLEGLQHQNIVRLVGFCHETRRELWTHNEKRVLAEVTRKALCFEYMENGSLDSYIFDESNGHGWRTRYAVIKGICNGLKYLHEEVKPYMLHLDLKRANILLDKNMIPKIADFGLSRFFKEDKSHMTNTSVGTFGYLPPEFVNENIISKKLDIFSLGVVIIKIMAGPEGRSRSVEMSSKKFIENVHGNWRNRLKSVASGDLLESYSEQVKICMGIALQCVEDDRQKRPTIGDIVNLLTETETQENYQGGLIDQMSTSMVDVHPLQLHFSFRPSKLISCPFHVTNNLDDQHVFVRCVPKHAEADCYYYRSPHNLIGIVPPRSTHTFVVTMKQVPQLPDNTDVLDIVVKTTILGDKTVIGWPLVNLLEFAKNSDGFREITLRAVCATSVETTTSEVILGGDYGDLSSMDVHPTEPWILAAYGPSQLVIWNYKTQTRIMVHRFHHGLTRSTGELISDLYDFHHGLAHSTGELISDYGGGIRSVRFIAQSTEQLFVVGDAHGYIHVHDCMTMKIVKRFKAHGDEVTSFTVHPTQPFVLSASRDQLIKLWNWEKGWVCIQIFTGHSGCVNQVKFNPHDDNTFASASYDGTVKIWRIFSPTHFTSLDCEVAQKSIDYYPTGGDQQHYMVTGSEWCFGPTNGMASIWDLRTQTCIREIKRLQAPCVVGVIGCYPDRPAVLVTAADSYGVSLVDSTTYRSERTVHFGLNRVVCFAYIKGIRSLAIAHDHGVAIMGIDEFYKNVLPPAR